ncbi:DUF1194 domain-containing protein [Methylopila henanensis]|uniref:DUF1194 domain-containing protein n=1 Tax=Methylopila henanensis TaxID=873516 RepID=A0ABW4K927_9HYPH
MGVDERTTRRGPLRLLTLLALAALLAAAPRATAADLGQVDLELVLAVDISYSMDVEEQQVQRDGYVAAITSKPVLDAIRDGLLGRVAVAYVEWAGADEQRTIVPWRLIDGPASAQAFADELAAQPLRRAYRTSISGALTHAVRMFDGNGYDGLRKVVDVSGDGPNNQGAPVENVRDEAIERGVVINGLPLMLKRPSYAMMDLVDLDVYYRDCVVGGPGAFVLPVRAIEQFAEAVRTKLVMEIAGLPPEAPAIGLSTAPRVQPAADDPTSSCTVGEQLWRDRFGN